VKHIPFIIILWFCLSITTATSQSKYRYQIPRVDVPKATDSIIAGLRAQKIDTILVYYEYRRPYSTYLYLQNAKKPYYVFDKAFISEYIVWMKNHITHAQKLNNFIIYKPVETKSQGIFIFTKANLKKLESEDFHFTQMTKDSNGKIKTLVGEGEMFHDCTDACPPGHNFVIYLNNEKFRRNVYEDNFQWDMNDSAFASNLSSCNHILQLMITEEVNKLDHYEYWATDEQLFYTRREFLAWKKSGKVN